MNDMPHAAMMDVFITVDAIVLSLASFLHPHDLVNLALTCKQFGGTPEAILAADTGTNRTDSNFERRSCIGNDDAAAETRIVERSWSLMEEAARQRVQEANNNIKWKHSDILSRHDAESWIAIDHRLHRMRTSLVFHRLLGNGIDHVKNDPAHVQIHERALISGQYPLGSSCAICQDVMKSGRHYAEFTVTREGYIEVGVMRPIEGWDTRKIKTMHPTGSNGYKDYCTRQQDSDGGYEGDVHYYLHQTSPDSYGRSNFMRKNNVVGLLLDFKDGGTLTVYKNGRCLGIKKEGLRGHYCWMVSMTNAVYRSAVKIARAPLPEN